MVSCSPCVNCDPPASASRQGQASEADDKAAQEAALAKKRKAQQAAEQRRLKEDINALRSELKGIDSGSANEIRLKAPPSESALRQLDCARQQSQERKEGHGDDWTYTADCKPVRKNMPIPTPVRADGAGDLSPVQIQLKERIAATRKELARKDNEISRLEKTVQSEEFKAPEIKKDVPQGESDVLRKAREALARAKAERERIAGDLSRLEKQEAAGSSSSAPTDSR